VVLVLAGSEVGAAEAATAPVQGDLVAPVATEEEEARAVAGVVTEAAGVEAIGKHKRVGVAHERGLMLLLKANLLNTVSFVRFEPLLCVAISLIAAGCSSVDNGISAKPWSERATQEEQQQLLSTSPEPDVIAPW